MANQRYYISCPVCLEQTYMAKSLGGGIYNMRDDQAAFLDKLYNWMWKHMLGCHKDEWKPGLLFTILSEYKEKEEL